MLLGAAAVLALVSDRADDRRLSVGPAERRDAGKLAQARARAVRGDQQPGREHIVAAMNEDTLAFDCERFDRTRTQRHADLARLGGERRHQQPVLHHVGERFARLDLTGEGEKHRFDRVAQAAIGHHHVENRLCVGDRAPHVDGLEQAPRAGRDRRRTRVFTGRSC